MEHGSFNLNDFHFKAWEPANEEAKRISIIQVFQDGDLIQEKIVPMIHTNIFGMDVDDKAALEAATEDLIKEVGAE